MDQSFILGALSVTVGALSVLFTAGSIYAAVVIYRQSQDYQRKIADLLSDGRALQAEQLRQGKAVLDETIAIAREELSKVPPGGNAAAALDERIARVERMSQLLVTELAPRAGALQAGVWSYPAATYAIEAPIGEIGDAVERFAQQRRDLISVLHAFRVVRRSAQSCDVYTPFPETLTGARRAWEQFLAKEFAGRFTLRFEAPPA